MVHVQDEFAWRRCRPFVTDAWPVSSHTISTKSSFYLKVKWIRNANVSKRNWCSLKSHSFNNSQRDETGRRWKHIFQRITNHIYFFYYYLFLVNSLIKIIFKYRLSINLKVLKKIIEEHLNVSRGNLIWKAHPENLRTNNRKHIQNTKKKLSRTFLKKSK